MKRIFLSAVLFGLVACGTAQTTSGTLSDEDASAPKAGDTVKTNDVKGKEFFAVFNEDKDNVFTILEGDVCLQDAKSLGAKDAKFAPGRHGIFFKVDDEATLKKVGALLLQGYPHEKKCFKYVVENGK